MRKLKIQKRYKVPLRGSSHKRAPGLGSRIVSHGPPVGRLCFLLLSQQRVDIREMLLLLYVPLSCILHMSVKCILNFTCVDFQSSEVSVDAVQLPTVRSGLSWMDEWW